jgi:hypothetical protein
MAVLIQNASQPGDDASPAASTGFQRQDLRHDVDRVSKGDRTMELPIEDRQKRQRIDSRRMTCKTCRDGQTEKPVGDRPAEGVADLRRMIYVERIEIAGETRKPHDVRLGHGPAWAFPLVTHDKIMKLEDSPGVACHVCRFPPYLCA